MEYFVIAHAIEILHGRIVENSSFDVTLMRDHLLVCLQLQILSPFPKTNEFIAVDLFVCFLMCTVSAEKPTFIMMLNQTTDILWQTATAVANGTTRSA